VPGYARTIIYHAHFEGVLDGLQFDFDATLPLRCRFAGVQQEIEEHALDLLRIEYTFHFARGLNRDCAAAKFRHGEDGIDGAPDGLVQRGGNGGNRTIFPR
jgi:hypothetical protein